MKRSAFATIDSTRLRHNLSIVRNHCGQAKIIAVVKANAYGHGMLECAQVLSSADAFAVACVNEAIALRENHCEHPIICLQGFSTADEMRACVQFNLQPVIHQPHQITLLNELDSKDLLNIWLKIDTGMGRLGFSNEQAITSYQQLKANSSVCQIRLMTHFANADHIDQLDTKRAVKQFKMVRNQLNVSESSAANSAALFVSDETHFQWVRPGLALYGVSPFEIDVCIPPSDQLRAAMKVYAPIISIRDFKAGQAIGYGGDYVCPRDCRIAVAAIGYCEGYPRTLYEQTSVCWKSHHLPVVGRVSMDMITIDTTNVPDCKIGDLVEIWGDNVSVTQLAKAANSIPYQILCNTFGNIQLKYS